MKPHIWFCTSSPTRQISCFNVFEETFKIDLNAFLIDCNSERTAGEIPGGRPEHHSR